MCFSATASFVASGALTLMSVATFLVARKKDKILVAIPILFGIQQAFEGIQWLHLRNGSTSPFAAYGFLFFALIVWPSYVPAFVFTLDKKRRRLLRVFVLFGALVSLYSLILLVTQPIPVREHANCITYDFHFPFESVALPLYMIAVLGALFVSSRAVFRWFGGAIAILSLVTWRLYSHNFVSVWCFFAAVVSALFFLYVQHKRWKRLRTAEFLSLKKG
jgi:heme/copper-type cytochrome/quinol oxidase subunit 4